MEVHSWTQFVDALLARKVAFLAAFFAVFLVTYALLAWADFLPELVLEPEVPAAETVVGVPESVVEQVVTTPVVEPVPEVLPVSPVYPLTLLIPALDTSVTVLNPTSRAVPDLDAALLEGVVRHPDSATLEQSGTVFILGHSSYLPAVRNKNFQALNGIQNLKWGDEVVIESLEGKYIYRVEKVYRARAQDVTVPIAGASKKLFLATCNSFGSVDDRYIVEADFLEIRPY
jgi:LPXTG-site transpeptidase (sortase) family protein